MQTYKKKEIHKGHKEQKQLKSRESSRARFALRKVHLANIDRNNLRCIQRTRGCVSPAVVNGEIRRPRNNKIFPSSECNARIYIRSDAKISSDDCFATRWTPRMLRAVGKDCSTERRERLLFRCAWRVRFKRKTPFPFYGRRRDFPRDVILGILRFFEK